jgi:hypothetical protein
MYYVFDRFGARHPARWGGVYPRIRGVKFERGIRISEPVPDPLEIRLKPINPEAADHGPEIPDYMKGPIPLFREDLLAALREVGVDNLDVYNAIIVDPETGARHTTHKAVNVVGLVAAAELGKSVATVHTGGAIIDVDFDRLQVDERRTRGVLMFRLAESINAILVHETVRDHLLANGFVDLEFLPPGDVAL